MASDHTKWAALYSGAGGALAGVALLKWAEFLWSLLYMLDLLPPPTWDQAVSVALAAALGGVVAVWAGWRRSGGTAAVDETASVIIRHALFFVLLLYSATKLMGAQFRLPYAALDMPLGDARGYALTWRFFGYSYAYEVFIACGQLVGVVLLLSWRTTTLGACILIGVLSNIVVVNFTHDLPVKLASTCYLAMACYLVVPDLPRLAALFVENRPFGARRPPAVVWGRPPGSLVALKAAFVLVSAVHAVAYVELGDSRPTPVSGAWVVETGTDPAAGPHGWQVVYFEREFGDTRPGSVRVGGGRGVVQFRYEFEPDDRRLRMKFAEPDRANDFVGTYEFAPDGACVLRGTRGPEAVTLRLVRKRT